MLHPDTLASFELALARATNDVNLEMEMGAGLNRLAAVVRDLGKDGDSKANSLAADLEPVAARIRAALPVTASKVSALHQFADDLELLNQAFDQPTTQNTTPNVDSTAPGSPAGESSAQGGTSGATQHPQVATVDQAAVYVSMENAKSGSS